MEVEVVDATPTSARVLVNGRVTLEFRLFGTELRKVAATTYDRGSVVVERREFMEARRLSYASISNKQKEEAKQAAKRKREPVFL